MVISLLFHFLLSFSPFFFFFCVADCRCRRLAILSFHDARVYFHTGSVAETHAPVHPSQAARARARHASCHSRGSRQSCSHKAPPMTWGRCLLHDQVGHCARRQDGVLPLDGHGARFGAALESLVLRVAVPRAHASGGKLLETRGAAKPQVEEVEPAVRQEVSAVADHRRRFCKKLGSLYAPCV
jgi:hypothetical protein